MGALSKSKGQKGEGGKLSSVSSTILKSERSENLAVCLPVEFGLSIVTFSIHFFLVCKSQCTVDHVGIICPTESTFSVEKHESIIQLEWLTSYLLF